MRLIISLFSGLALSVLVGMLIDPVFIPVSFTIFGIIFFIVLTVAGSKCFHMRAKEYIFVITRSETGITKYKCRVYSKGLAYYLTGLSFVSEVPSVNEYGNCVETVYRAARISLKNVIEAYEENHKGNPEIRIVLRSDILEEN